MAPSSRMAVYIVGAPSGGKIGALTGGIVGAPSFGRVGVPSGRIKV